MGETYEAFIIVRRCRDDATITMREVLFARNDGRVLVTAECNGRIMHRIVANDDYYQQLFRLAFDPDGLERTG